MSDHKPLLDYLRRVPGIDPRMGQATEGDRWWVKLVIDVRHPLAWRVVQELAHVLNYLSVEERLPAVFKPVSPPPYMNGGPKSTCPGSSSRSLPSSPRPCARSGWRGVCRGQSTTWRSGTSNSPESGTPHLPHTAAENAGTTIHYTALRRTAPSRLLPGTKPPFSKRAPRPPEFRFNV